MSRLPFQLSFLLLLSPAWALRCPQTKEELGRLAAIDSLIVREKIYFKMKTAELNKKLFDASLKIDNDVEISALNKKGDDILAAHKAVMTDIVQKTADLYDIQPRPAGKPEDGGAIVKGPFARTRPKWAPVYAPERRVKIVSLEGQDVSMTADPGYAGITWADGSVELNDRAFDYSPGYLAAIILHESVHFAQWTTKGKGDTISAVMAEMEAHSADCARDAMAAFNLTKVEIGAVQRAFTAQLEKFRRNPKAGMMSSQFASDDGITVEEEIRRSREAAQQASDDVLRSSLRDIALEACTGDGVVKQEELDALPTPSSPHFRDGELPEPLVGGGCAGAIYIGLSIDRSSGRRPTLAEIHTLSSSPPAAASPAWTPPAAAIPEPPLRPVSNALMAFLQYQMKVMLYVVGSACRTGDELSDDDVQRYRKAFSALEKHNIEPYTPENAMYGLSGCDRDLMAEFLRYPDNDLNNNARSVLEAYFPPVVSPTPQPRQNPQPRPTPRPKDCHDYGNKYCP